MVEPQPFGRYLLRRRLASGGMGEVFVAEQTGVGDFRKPLALKIMLPTLVDDERHVRLFLAEARLAARLTHPNIVQVFDAGMIDGRYFLAMELVDGVTLGDVIKTLHRTGRRADLEVLCLVARQTLEALRYAHALADDTGSALELVHRDISPSNILVSRRGEVKLTDFGIAKVRGAESNTAPGEVRGKLAYIAPELYKGASASVRSDLFALGVTLYRLAALQSPFPSATDSDPISAIVRHERVPLATLRPDLPQAITSAIDRAMAAEPSQRFASAAAMLEAFPRGDLEARQEALARLIASAPPPAAPVTLHTAPFELGTATMVDEPTEPPRVAAPPPARGLGRLPVRQRAMVLLGGLGVLLTAIGVGVGVHGVKLPPRGVATPPPVVEAAPPAPAAEAPSAAPVEAEPEPAAEASDEPETEAPAGPASKVGRSRRSTGRLQPPAYLSVQARPWANVEINGRKIGQTPLARVPVTSPSVTVRLTNPGFQTVERKLKLGAGEEYKLNEALPAR